MKTRAEISRTIGKGHTQLRVFIDFPTHFVLLSDILYDLAACQSTLAETIRPDNNPVPGRLEVEA